MEERGKKKRLVIIPDVHGRGFWRKAVSENPGGEFIFLGDYLDPYRDEGVTTEEGPSVALRKSSVSRRSIRTG